MGDFNEVHVEEERFGSKFDLIWARHFNDFIANSGLVDMKLDGYSFTWAHKSARKMSKLARFLVSGGVFNSFPHVSAICLDRKLSDHRPILLRELDIDYDAFPFRVFQSWFLKFGFDDMVEQAWSSMNINDSNHLIRFKKKLQSLKARIKEWNMQQKSVTEVEMRIQDINSHDQKDYIQKAKVKWAVEGDENSNFFHEVINKKRSSMTIRGIFIDAEWVSNPAKVKAMFKSQFASRFRQNFGNRCRLAFEFPTQLTTDQVEDMERPISKDEIRNAVWDCGENKSSGPNGFTFEVFRRYWTFIGDDLCEAVEWFFLYDKQILDGLFIINEIISWCKQKKIQAMLFKVDFAKAYDSIRWDFLDDVLQAFGFGIKWRTWVKGSLSSAMAFILLNGSPTSEFNFECGLKQGDPLSPYLFILIMESLHLSFVRTTEVGNFQGLQISDEMKLSHLFYADDVVFICDCNMANINNIVHVLHVFVSCFRLKININKSNLMGIRVANSVVIEAAKVVGCSVMKTPFRYLRIMVGGYAAKKAAWEDTIRKMRLRLSKWNLQTLSIGGRLTLLKSVLGASPIYRMSIYKVPYGVLKEMESIRSRFFNGIEDDKKKITWFSWNKVLSFKDSGGLGVSSFFALNRALLFKWVWIFVSKDDSMWYKVISAIHGPSLKSSSRSILNGSNWIEIIQELNSLKSKGIDIMSHFAVKFSSFGGIQNYRREPRDGVEKQQFTEMNLTMNQICLATTDDRWSWDLNGEGSFVVKDMRNLIDGFMLPKEENVTRWIKYIPIKVNIFAWKVRLNRLPSRINLSQRGILLDSLDYPVCLDAPEDLYHCFFRCEVANGIMILFCRWWNIDWVPINSYDGWLLWFNSIRLNSKIKKLLEGACYVMW
nr:RNA-directed DNA polymerase, eukaryota [Tanacetum cinerariifolium]